MKNVGLLLLGRVKMVLNSVPLMSFVFGLLLGAGMLLIASSLAFWQTPALAKRIEPYLRDVLIANETDAQGFKVLGNYRSFREYLKSKILQRSVSVSATKRLLTQAGRNVEVSEFRWSQFQGAVIGFIVGGLVFVTAWLFGNFNPALAILPLVLAALFAFALEWRLKSAAKRKVRLMRDDLPTVLEFIALSLTAGESLPDAIKRTAQAHGGELAQHLHRVLLAAKTGSRLADALSDMASSLDLPALHRAVEQLRAALSSGAPLSEVLHAQAMDVRSEQKRELLEAAGKKELQMLIPLVFLVLPISVVFAIFPGVYLLQNSFN